MPAIPQGLRFSDLPDVDVTKEYGVSTSATAAQNKSRLQSAFNNESSILIPTGDYEVDGPITIGATVTKVRWEGRLVTSYLGVQDSDSYPLVDFNGFLGTVFGRVRILHSAPGSTIACDGIRLKNTLGAYIQSVSLDGVRFGVLLDTNTDFRIGEIIGNNLLGWQAGVAGNGGSICSMYSNTGGLIDTVSGSNVGKAAVYFSVDGSGTNNSSIAIGKIRVGLANTDIANGLAIRSADGVTIGEIFSEGGISAVRVEKRDDGAAYKVRGVTIGKVICRNATAVSSDSAGVSLNTIGGPHFDDITIGLIDVDGAEDDGLYVANAGAVRIGSLKTRNCSGRGIQIGGVVKSLSINYADIGSTLQAVQSQVEAVGSGDFKIDNLLIVDRGASATIPINFAPNCWRSIKFGYIEDLTATTAYSSVCYFTTEDATRRLTIENVISVATYAAIMRGNDFTKIVNGRLYMSAAPSTSTFPADTIVYKSGSTASGPHAWVLTTTGFKATANLAA